MLLAIACCGAGFSQTVSSPSAMKEVTEDL